MEERALRTIHRQRACADIPGTKGIVWLSNSAHLPMLERQQAFSDIAVQYFSDGASMTPQ